MTRSVQRALDILHALRDAEEPLSLSELANNVGIDPATCKRLSDDLMERAMIERHPVTKRYALSWGLAHLTKALWTPDSLAQVALRHLEELRDKTLHTVELCTRLGGDYFVALELPGLQPLKYAMGVGTSRPLASDAPGLVMLAFGAEADVVDQGDAGGPGPPIPHIRANGYAYTEEPNGRAAALAAPVLDTNGTAVAAVSVLWVLDDLRPAGNDLSRLRLRVVECARRVSRVGPNFTR